MKKIVILLSVCLLLFNAVGCAAVSEQKQNEATVITALSDAPQSEEATQTVEEPEAAETNTNTNTNANKITLTVAGVNCSESKLNMVINEFNKTDSVYRINLIDYGYGVSVEQGITKLQTQVIAGNAPDMILFQTKTGNSPLTLSPLSYISTGVLLDLDDFVTNDPELNKDDFIIWDALHEFDGMYLLGSKFSVYALRCTPENVEKYENWTLTDYLALQDAMQPGQKLMYYMTPEFFIERIGGNYLHEAVDMEHATCDFDNPTFISLLETTAQVVSTITESEHTQADGSFKTGAEMQIDGEILFVATELNSSADVAFDRYRSGGVRLWYGDDDKNPYADRTGGTTPMGYVGYPTTDGSNGMYIEMPEAVGICSSSEYADGCWQFIRYMLQNPVYQDIYDGTPQLYSKLEDNLQMMKNVLDGNGKWTVTQEDQNLLVSLAERCEKMSYFDEDILGIIQEEAAELLSGAITAETAAERIQNRASILVMERYG